MTRKATVYFLSFIYYRHVLESVLSLHITGSVIIPKKRTIQIIMLYMNIQYVEKCKLLISLWNRYAFKCACPILLGVGSTKN